jgi:hypothetical protein
MVPADVLFQVLSPCVRTVAFGKVAQYLLFFFDFDHRFRSYFLRLLIRKSQLTKELRNLTDPLSVQRGDLKLILLLRVKELWHLY